MRSILAEIYSIWISERPNQLAAALAYYGIFSFAPVIYLAFTIANILIDQIFLADQFYLKMEKLLGPQTAVLIQDLVGAVSGSNRSGTFLVSLISFLALFFAASGLFFQLQYALNKVYNVPPPQKGQTRAFIRERLFSFLMVIGVGLLLVFATLLNLVVTWFGSLLETFIGFDNSQIFLTWLATLGLIAISFAALYKVLPNVRIAWRDVWPGAFVSAILVMLAGTLMTMFFSLGRVGSAFEAAGAFTVLMMVIYYIAQIFLLGAVITRVYAARYGSRKSNKDLASERENYL